VGPKEDGGRSEGVGYIMERMSVETVLNPRGETESGNVIMSSKNQCDACALGR
jgi:hypothetical protein